MNKLASILAALSLTAASSSAVANPPNPPGQNGADAELLGFCHDLLAEFQGNLNLGECMSFNSVSDPGFRTKLCDYLLETDQLEDFDFTSYSDCVRNIS